MKKILALIAAVLAFAASAQTAPVVDQSFTIEAYVKEAQANGWTPPGYETPVVVDQSFTVEDYVKAAKEAGWQPPK